MYSDQLSDILRTALQSMVRFRQFSDVKEGKGLSKGARLYWNIYGDTVNAGGPISETQTMPETNYVIRQESLVVTEYGIGVPFTAKLDNLSKHSVTEVVNKVLKNNARKALDYAAWGQWNLALLTVTPASGNSATAITLETTGTPTATNNVAMNKTHVKLISDQMKERDITPFDGEHYGCIARPSTYRTFKNELEAVYQYVDQGFQLIYNGEIGRYEGIRFIEQTAVASAGWTNGLSDRAYFFGADTVAEGIVIPEEIRGKIPTDFGRDRGIAWYYLGGFGLCHTDAPQGRIIRWASAA
ncbi:hypothetical protein [Sphingomonas sp.]|jgi:hypothetical protein|uniref:hypothetical protein n=1 Tax=Sphingomonas sp. TaxID=28214 RepID=UPI0035637382